MPDNAGISDESRDARHPPAGVGALAAVRHGLCRRGRGSRLRPGDLADARRPRRVPADWRRHRCGHQGDVRLRRQGRAPRRAAARADGIGVPGVRAAPAVDAVEGLVHRLAIPLREAAARPLPPVRPGRHRGARRRRPVPRRRGHRARLGVLPGARPHPGDVAAELARRARGSRPLRRCAARVLRGQPRRPQSPESQITLDKNPLRVLDSKRPSDAAIVAAAPRIAEFYSADAAAHFEAVQAGLAALDIPFTIDDTLVRGLDYYRHTTFEFQGGTLDSAPERARWRRPLRRPGRVAGRSADPRHRLRARPRPHAAGLRRRGRVRPPARGRRFRRRHHGRSRSAATHGRACVPPASPPTGPTRTAA